MNLSPIQMPAKTIDEVLIQLDEIIKQSAHSENFIFAFAFVYRETTAKIKDAISDGVFEDNIRMEKLDVVFANLFIEAYNHFESCQPTSKSWSIAFDSGKTKLSLVQYILLGMNAHINLDLSIAASRISQGKDILSLKNDFMHVNTILAGLTNTMQRSLGKVSFMMKLLDIFGFRSDEKIINFSIKKARDFSWINAMELALMDQSGLEKRINEIDIRVAELAMQIKNPPGKIIKLILKLIRIFEVKRPADIIRKMSS